jgi:hypothetical protein
MMKKMKLIHGLITKRNLNPLKTNLLLQRTNLTKHQQLPLAKTHSTTK